MSGGSSKSDGDSSSFDIEELLRFRTRCTELRKEKETLRESQSHSFALIKRLELHAKSLSEAHVEDGKRIQKLERELLNCSQEIGEYLQDQLNARNEEIYSLGEHIHDLELKLVDMEHLQMEVGQLMEDLRRSDSEHLLLMQELNNREEELRSSALCMEKLEESISSLTLDSQCEIETMRLDIISLEQACLEAKKVQEENTQEKAKLTWLIKELEIRVHSSEATIECLEKEKFELEEKLLSYEMNRKVHLQEVEELLENKDRLRLNGRLHSSKPETQTNMLRDMGEVLGLPFSKLEIELEPESNLKEQVERMSRKISEYEVLVKHLKVELREEKLKAKEEAEDLAQEMAELRYQMTALLEEECKRRACIEQASLQRIAELEAQIQKEQRKSFPVVKPLREA